MTRGVAVCGVLAALAAWAAVPVASVQAPAHNVVLITLDGARVEEMFGGFDVEALRGTLKPKEQPPRSPRSASARTSRPACVSGRSSENAKPLLSSDRRRVPERVRPSTLPAS